MKGSRPTTAHVPDPPVFDVARDNSLRSEGGAEMSDV
jgi:hypothetical protein